MADLHSFLLETKFKADFKLRKITLAEQSQWSIRKGALSHFSNGFFHVAGIKNRRSDEEHLVFYQPQSALTGLALFRDGPDLYFLLQARIEPGLGNIAQYGPTIQSTAANFMQMHGGKETSYVEYFRSFSPLANPLGNTIQFDLGQRYFQKQKMLSYVELARQVATEENMIWAPLPLLAAVLASDNFLNPDLRSLLSAFDWDLYLHPQAARQQLCENPASDRLAFSANLLGSDEWRLTTLDQLRAWRIQPGGIADVSNSGIWVDMFHVSAYTREVREWSQPLMCCANQGLVVQFVRMVDGRYEFLLSFDHEFGISGQRVALPSLVIYPGDNVDDLTPAPAGDTPLREMFLTEEGGRFFRNESLYRVVLAAPGLQTAEHQQWVTAPALQAILKSSSQASLQLRCTASLVLDWLNPISFA